MRSWKDCFWLAKYLFVHLRIFMLTALLRTYGGAHDINYPRYFDEAPIYDT